MFYLGFIQKNTHFGNILHTFLISWEPPLVGAPQAHWLPQDVWNSVGCFGDGCCSISEDLGGARASEDLHFKMKILQNQGFHWFLVNFDDFQYIPLIFNDFPGFSWKTLRRQVLRGARAPPRSSDIEQQPSPKHPTLFQTSWVSGGNQCACGAPTSGDYQLVQNVSKTNPNLPFLCIIPS